MLAVAWFRFRTTLRRRWGGYLAIVLLIGLIGGLAMGAIAGARRTQSSYPAFLRSTNPTNIGFPTAAYGLNGSKVGYDPALITKVAHLPHVKHVESDASLNVSPVQADGKEFVPSGPNLQVNPSGSIDGEYIDLDRIAVTNGRMLDPTRANELVVSAPVARALRAHIGSIISFAFYTNAQEAAPGPSGSEYRSHAYLRVNVKLVGIGVYNDTIVADDVDAAGANFSLFSPALTRRLTACCTSSTFTAIQLDRGSRDVPAVELELEKLSPLLSSHIYLTGIDEAKTERAVEPDSIALAVFGLIAALAALLLASQLIGRQLRAGADERDTIRALGAGPGMMIGDGLIGAVGAIVIGALLAAAVAVALSPLAPLGPVRTVYPSLGLAFDWAVLGLGVAFLIVALTAISAGFAYRQAPHRVAARSKFANLRQSRASRFAAASAVPAPIATGIRFALEPGRGRNTVPVRSAILGAALAMVVVVSTLTFGTSLHTLISRPALYGWNWDYELSGGNGGGAIPQHLSDKVLADDHDVAAWNDVYFGGARINGVSIPALGGDLNTSVGPPTLSGHGLDRPDQIVLGAETLAQLHEHVGKTVMVQLGPEKPLPMQIVGTATMPAIGGSGSLHMEMGIGALFSYQLIPAALRDPSGNTPNGPNAIFVRFRTGVNRAAALKKLDQLAANTLSLQTNWGVTVVAVQHPAEIVNYRSLNNTPLLLGGALAAGAVLALALTLIASVRRRRHDLALLKTLGFTRRQLAAVVAWQSTIAVTVGTIIGVPLGVVVGRSLWDLFARQIHAVPEPTIPALTIALIAIGALVLANVVAAIPGRQAARTQTAVLLREE